MARQLYFPDTAILITRFMTAGGVGEVLDFMPVDDPHRASDRHRLVRVVRCVRGQIPFEIERAPRVDYGRQEHQLELTGEGRCSAPRRCRSPCTAEGPGDAASRRRRPRRAHVAGRPDRGVMLESAAGGPPRTMTPDELLGLVNETARFWRGWLCDHWDQPEEGIWDTRGGRQNFTYG